MKTPDEIKKALECCFFDSERCADCPYYPVSCDVELVRDAREYIRQLESERDAAVRDMPTSCILCKRFQKKYNTCNSKKPCDRIGGVRTEWQWRGVQKEE